MGMIITFDVKYDEHIKKGMELRVTKIARSLAAILEVHKGAIEIQRARRLSTGGFHLEIHVYVDERVGASYQEMMQTAIDRGLLAQAFQENWKLASAPIITKLNCSGSAVEMLKLDSHSPSSTIPKQKLNS